MTPENIARICHEANRAYQLATGDPAPSAQWDDAPAWQRSSAIEGVHRAILGDTPEQLHESWCRTKEAAGWDYGPVKDEARRTHPCLVPYADLPEHQRIKDRLCAAIVGALS